MKKLILMVMALCLISSVAFADSLVVGDTIKKLPALKQGIGYSIKNSNIEYLSTLEVANYKGVSIEAGYSSQDKVVAVLSYKILKLKDLGVSLPILDLMYFLPGIYLGYGLINSQEIDRSKLTYGVSITLLDIKF
jgi:hypothetical protein